MKQARENLELRVVSTGKGWRVDAHLVGGLQTSRIGWFAGRDAAIACGRRVAEASLNLDYYGYVRLMVEDELTRRIGRPENS